MFQHMGSCHNVCIITACATGNYTLLNKQAAVFNFIGQAEMKRGVTRRSFLGSAFVAGLGTMAFGLSGCGNPRSLEDEAATNALPRNERLVTPLFISAMIPSPATSLDTLSILVAAVT